MNRIYKLAANFNTVEFEISEDDILKEIKSEEVEYDDEDEDIIAVDYDKDYDIVFPDSAKENALKRILQREYDILASIKVVNVAPAPKAVVDAPKAVVDAPKAVDAPSEKQCDWARNLGMKNPEKKTKQEVWSYIKSHKDEEYKMTEG